ncbi:MAG: DUF615 domain-containing protein [Desulfuromonadales bacterium]|nr:DUF615 domain-containing protein [Desulfuromonadales bacterium]
MAEKKEHYSTPSRSARKREAQAVEVLARQLAELPETQLSTLPLSPEIRLELQQLRGIRALPARDRQIRHLAAMLRQEEELLPQLNDFLAGNAEVQLAQRQQFHQLEQWRDGLCDAQQCAATLVQINQQLPAADASSLQRLARAAQTGDRRAYREIFRVLRQAAG